MHVLDLPALYISLRLETGMFSLDKVFSLPLKLPLGVLGWQFALM